MTADLVAELRGIIAAKPPHVTVLADNSEVYPIRGALLTEVADRLAAAEARTHAAEKFVDHDMKRMEERLEAAERWMRHAMNDHADECGTCVEFAKTTVAYLQDRKTSRDAELTPGVRNASADVAGTPEQFKQWVLDDLKDPKNFAELKSRSDEANAKMAARPFTDDSNPTGAAGGNILGKAWRDKRLDRADKAPDLNSEKPNG